MDVIEAKSLSRCEKIKATRAEELKQQTMQVLHLVCTKHGSSFDDRGRLVTTGPALTGILNDLAYAVVLGDAVSLDAERDNQALRDHLAAVSKASIPAAM